MSTMMTKSGGRPLAGVLDLPVDVQMVLIAMGGRFKDVDNRRLQVAAPSLWQEARSATAASSEQEKRSHTPYRLQ